MPKPLAPVALDSSHAIISSPTRRRIHCSSHARVFGKTSIAASTILEKYGLQTNGGMYLSFLLALRPTLWIRLSLTMMPCCRAMRARMVPRRSRHHSFWSIASMKASAASGILEAKATCVVVFVNVEQQNDGDNETCIITTTAEIRQGATTKKNKQK